MDCKSFMIIVQFGGGGIFGRTSRITKKGTATMLFLSGDPGVTQEARGEVKI